MWALVASAADDGSVKTTVEAIADTHDQIVLALIAVVATSVAGLVFVLKNGANARTAAEQSTAANKAVNGVGPEHRLWDKIDRIERNVDRLMVENEEFSELGWNRLPSDLGDAVALTETVRSIQSEQEECRERLQVIKEMLAEHVEWEMNVKYGPGGGVASSP